MMAAKAKVVGQKKDISDYEKQRMERLKRNADFMEAKGYGTLANKIYQEKAQMQLQTLREAGLISDEDEDDLDYIGEEGDDNEAEISNNVGSMKASKTILKQPRPKIVQSSTKTGTMGEYLEKYEKAHMDQPTKSRSNQQVLGHFDSASSSTFQKQSQVIPAKRQEVKKHVQEPVIPAKNQQVKKKFCPPGAMSAYLKLRNKQVQNMIGDSEVERNDVAHEQDPNCTYATEGGFESELQLGGSERPTVNEEEPEPAAQQLEIQPTTERPTEAPKMKKTRGPTKMDKAHARTLNERPVIVVNEFGQPVGPSKEVVNEFTRFIGTLAKDSERAPLNFVKWPDIKLKEKENIWEYIQTKYLVPEQCKKWVIGKLGINWRIYKCRTKQKHYYAHGTSEERLNDRPPTISEPQYQQLINYWDNPTVEEKSKRNRGNRQLVNDTHTMGPKSYARFREELKQEDPEHREPSHAKVYMESRRRNPKKTYKTKYEKTEQNIKQMEALSAQPCGDESNYSDPYYDVFKKPEHYRRPRLYGHGVTKSDLKKKGEKPGYIFPQEFVQGIQMDLLEKLQKANPEVNLVIPECFGGNSTTGQSLSPSKNQEQHDFNGPCIGNDQLIED